MKISQGFYATRNETDPKDNQNYISITFLAHFLQYCIVWYVLNLIFLATS